MIEKANHEGHGKSTFVDPIMTGMLVEIKALREGQSATVGRAGTSTPLIMVMITSIASVVAGLILEFRHPRALERSQTAFRKSKNRLWLPRGFCCVWGQVSYSSTGRSIMAARHNATIAAWPASAAWRDA